MHIKLPEIGVVSVVVAIVVSRVVGSTVDVVVAVGH